MPHVPDYNCTPPSGGGKLSKYVGICVLIVLVVVCVKVGSFIAAHLIWFLLGAALGAGLVTYKFFSDVHRALQARTWKMEDASVMSKHDAQQVYYGGRYPRHPLDGGSVIEGDVVSEYPKAITEGNRKRTSGLPPWREGEREGSSRGEAPGDSESRWPKKRP